ncbi:MAG: hypothetical protein NC548_63850 [Lachnospiraceae bacterium]|nr:hypothetical protein [Lachnospiraceae bacterium]
MKRTEALCSCESADSEKKKAEATEKLRAGKKEVTVEGESEEDGRIDGYAIDITGESL